MTEMHCIDLKKTAIAATNRSRQTMRPKTPGAEDEKWFPGAKAPAWK